MPINKGDRLGHRHGFFGTALTAETNGAVQVQHDSGVVSTWAAADAAVIRRSAQAPASAQPQSPGGAASKRPRTKKRAGKRPAAKKAAKKGAKRASAKKGASRKSKPKKRTSKVPSVPQAPQDLQ